MIYKKTDQVSKHFKASEFLVDGGNAQTVEINAKLPEYLEKLMDKLGLDTLGITSGYRTLAQENALKGGVGSSSQHVKGNAVDTPLKYFKGLNAQKVVDSALMSGFTGVGVYDWGYHFDVRPQETVSFWDERSNKTPIKIDSSLLKVSNIVYSPSLPELKGKTLPEVEKLAVLGVAVALAYGIYVTSK